MRLKKLGKLSIPLSALALASGTGAWLACATPSLPPAQPASAIAEQTYLRVQNLYLRPQEVDGRVMTGALEALEQRFDPIRFEPNGRSGTLFVGDERARFGSAPKRARSWGRTRRWSFWLSGEHWDRSTGTPRSSQARGQRIFRSASRASCRGSAPESAAGTVSCWRFASSPEAPPRRRAWKTAMPFAPSMRSRRGR
jgi:hypothetical protein